MTITNYHWGFDDCVMHETDETGATTVTYTHEPGPFGPLISENRGGTTYYHHDDALGSTIALTNDAGTVTDALFYDAWGSKQPWSTGTTPTPYTWCGRWGYQDDTATTGGYYIRARTYGPVVARWTSVDPAWLRLLDNAFLYGLNCPLITIDPSGMIQIRCNCRTMHVSSQQLHYYTAIVNCAGWAATCCQTACATSSLCSTQCHYNGDFTIVPQPVPVCRFMVRSSGVSESPTGCGCGPLSHKDIYSTCDGEIRTGAGGSTNPEFVPTEPTVFNQWTDTALNQVGWGMLNYGRLTGTACVDATYDDILQCIRAAPPARFNFLLNNCQQDVERVAGDCCLFGFQSFPFPPIF